MLNQTFSAENLFKIVDYENRKGNYLEKDFFGADVVNLSKKIVALNGELRGMRGKASKEDFKAKYAEKDLLLLQKKELILLKLESIGKNISDGDYKINLTKFVGRKSKDTYLIEKSAESFFALKYVQHNINRLYKVKQANRNSIIKQICTILDSSLPKVIVRTDIESFYETLPANKILEKINADNLLSNQAKKIIWKIVKEEYQKKYSKILGLPRGVGISAYLSELYMRDLDSYFKKLDGVIYYARYVDDIVVIFQNEAGKQKEDFKDLVVKVLEDQTGLTVNSAKTRPYVHGGGATANFEYLGYQIYADSGPVKVDLSPARFLKIRNRVKIAFDIYKHNKYLDEKKQRKILYKRIRFLCGNTRLSNRKKNVMVGIYFSNLLLNKMDSIQALDDYLSSRILADISSTRAKAKLNGFKFKDGFENKKFNRCCSNDLKQILSVWKHEK